ncbi:MAG: family N-acetyltransferase [Hydrocarboniphaga sp.]|uniref:GNAT family N-acetyltransferase n=1 Tax=Hydrocarboniphaga sp. TaxID=2033016 RepID=UPI0026307AAC|nr:GNAT family N-acetyltransferase [Hydrocarboniphaga sp.]MDB5970527.1 family N-acetyltransferase [Hydrocarboniphaga sp.]
MEGLRLERLGGAGILQRMDALAALRIRVFRDWPYLYEGSAEYEAHYLQVYVDCPRSLAVLVWDGGRCVGASTCLPLADALPDMQQPFVEHGMDLSRIDYFGESVLLREYRGRGVGVEFFRQREAHARAQGLRLCAFCSVDRDADDARKPADYVANDAFWSHRGYRQQPQMQSRFSWPDIGETGSSAKRMTFWMRELPA